MRAYVDATGHAPVPPDYSLGYWHSKNRYASQSELLAAAEGLHSRGIPTEVIVIDYHHWVNMGDWSFDPKAWPDVPGMMRTLAGYGMHVMVSVWPFSAVGSSSIAAINASDLAVNVNGSNNTPVWWDDNNCNAKCFLYDATKASARAFVWDRVKAGYLTHNISVYWLDAAEPEISTADAQRAADTSAYSIGSAQSVGMMFPYWHTRTFHDGLVASGVPSPIMLTRSAWAGMQRWGAALWSGDTHSAFSSLKVSIQAGLNVQMSGIALWTTDIGGYAGGNPSDAGFRELIVRWFQFGLTCPLFRQHGARATEPWLLGNESYAAVTKAIGVRQQLRAYVKAALAETSRTGLPVNRPLFWDYPEDAQAWHVDDTYMFGPTMLAAPVTDAGARSRNVYLPGGSGVTWQHYFTNHTFKGGQWVNVSAPLDQFPLFTRQM